METYIIEVLDSQAGVLGLFTERRLAEASLRYSYHAIPDTKFEWTDRLTFKVTVPAGRIDTFTVRERCVYDSVQHL